MPDSEKFDRALASRKFSPEGSIFAPETVQEIRDRLAFIAANECLCGESPHLNALHDLAHVDVPALLAVLSELTATDGRRLTVADDVKSRIAEAMADIPSPIAAKQFEPGFWRSCASWDQIIETLATAASAVAADAPKQVDTIEDLREQPVSAVVRAADGDIWQRHSVGWDNLSTGAGPIKGSKDIALPALVLWTPEPANA